MMYNKKGEKRQYIPLHSGMTERVVCGFGELGDHQGLVLLNENQPEQFALAASAATITTSAAYPANRFRWS
jgi:hypothetical protein